MRARHRQQGFTLTELLVAVFLAGILAAAAFHIHYTFQSSFHRQEQITQMQQTMKVTRALLARYLRGAGAGVNANFWSSCGSERQIGPFVLHNSNPFGSTDLSDGGDDPDPDWFEVTGGDMNVSSPLSHQSAVTSAVRPVLDPAKFKPGDVIGVGNEKGMCLFMVTHVMNNDIQHRPVANQLPMAACYNADHARQKCEDVLQTHFLEAGGNVINFSARTAAFRIDDTDPKRPLLMMAAGAAGGDPTLYQWQPIAEGVEDMQIGLHVDTSNPADTMGDVWVNSRDLRANELDRVRAVRLSLVMRSLSEVPGLSGGRRPGLEDRQPAAVTDGYVRRVVTTVFKLRNMPRESTP